MAVLYIAEFATIGGSSNFNVQGGQTPPIAEQVVVISVGHTESTNAFNTNTKFVRVAVDAVCSIAFGVTPVATTSTMRMAANQTEYFAVQAGQKISVIANS